MHALNQGHKLHTVTSFQCIEGEQLCKLLDLPEGTPNQILNETLRLVVTRCEARYSRVLESSLPKPEKSLSKDWQRLKPLIDLPNEGDILASRLLSQSDQDIKQFSVFKEAASQLVIFTPTLANATDVLKRVFDVKSPETEIPDAWKICLVMRNAFARHQVGALTNDEMQTVTSLMRANSVSLSPSNSQQEKPGALGIGTTDMEWRWSPTRKRFEPAFAKSKFINGDSTLIGLSVPYRTRMFKIYEDRLKDSKEEQVEPILYTMEVIKLCELVARSQLEYPDFVVRMKKLNFLVPPR